MGFFREFFPSRLFRHVGRWKLKIGFTILAGKEVGDSNDDDLLSSLPFTRKNRFLSDFTQ